MLAFSNCLKTFVIVHHVKIAPYKSKSRSICQVCFSELVSLANMAQVVEVFKHMLISLIYPC